MTQAHDNLRHHLEQMATLRWDIIEKNGVVDKDEYVYSSPEEIVLTEGEEYDGDRNFAEPFMMGEPKQCFSNALHAALQFDLKYVEGFILHYIPIHHAWCVDDDGQLFEVTLSSDMLAEAYIGVPMNGWTVANIVEAKGYYGVFDDWQNNWPALRQSWNLEELAHFYRELDN